MKKNADRGLNKLVPLLSVLPFVIGTIGYIIAGERISDSLYFGISLYFANINSDSYNILIEIARWTALLVTTAAVLCILERMWFRISCIVKCFHRDSVAVYSDSDIRLVFEDSAHSAIYPGRELYSRAKSHIIMLDTDMDSLRFYYENRTKLKDKKIYIAMKQIEYSLMKDTADVVFFDIDGAIARGFWKSVKLWENPEENKKLVITIYGNGHLGQNILNYALLLNLFSLQQEITYYFIGDSPLYQAAHGTIETCNNDCVYFHTFDDDIWNVIGSSDLVITSQEVSVEELQTIGVVCRTGKVFYFSPKEGDAGRYLKLDNLYPYGSDGEIYTDENIRRGKLIQQAKLLNYEYVLNYCAKDLQTNADAEWNKIDGFLKWSNISSADYSEVIMQTAGSAKKADIEELAELEHIRWCRFHYLNYWQYGIPDNGTSKDSERRIHTKLCDYADLDEADKQKARAIVKKALNLPVFGLQ